MAIKEGEKLPDVKVTEMIDGAPTQVSLAELSKGKRVVVFAVPGAFTPTCSNKHLPGFIQQAGELRKKGVDEVACISVNDAFVMSAWGVQQNAASKVRMLADGNGEFARAVGLTMDASGFGMGERSKRYAMIVRDGKVETLLVEPAGGLNVSSAESVLAKL
jgi:glutaredoxin/glutathione-dependent peroxiredoxin